LAASTVNSNVIPTSDDTLYAPHLSYL